MSQKSKSQQSKSQLLASLPNVGKMVQSPDLQDLRLAFGEPYLVRIAQRALQSFRDQILSAKEEELESLQVPDWEEAILQEIYRDRQALIQRVINVTGTIIHTNLGRAPLPMEIFGDLQTTLTSYCTLEYDIRRGERGYRGGGVEQLLSELLGAEAAAITNNNAAAMLLILATLKDRYDDLQAEKLKGLDQLLMEMRKKGAGLTELLAYEELRERIRKEAQEPPEILVARSELVEIGGSFRIPDIISRSGMRLVALGCTNKIKESDYAKAINSRTCGILKVHRSNFYLGGFTEEPSLADLVRVAHDHQLPLIYDLGSGLLEEDLAPEMQTQPKVKEGLAAGVDVLCFSGDKLFGGPQAGMILGSREFMDRLKHNQLMRALRVDKFTLLSLEKILAYYEAHREANIPVLRQVGQKPEVLLALARQVEEDLYRDLGLDGADRAERTEAMQGQYGVSISVEKTQAKVGGGTAPNVLLPSYALRISFGEEGPQANAFEAFVRTLPLSKEDLQARLIRKELTFLPIIGRIEDGAFWADMRSLLPGEEPLLVKGLVRAFQTILKREQGR